MEKEKIIPGYVQRREGLYNLANTLIMSTIYYKVFEGIIALVFGIVDETIILFGFGIASFVQAVYSISLWHMIQRSGEGSFVEIDQFEKKIFKIAGTSFYVLASGLIIAAVISIVLGHKPYGALSGIIISVISMATMSVLYLYKKRTGEKLKAETIMDDAGFTKARIYLPSLPLLSCLVYAISGIAIIDAAGSMLYGVVLISEGYIALKKAG